MILALDPGGTTGVCLYNPIRNTTEVEELGDGSSDHHIELWNMLTETLAESYEHKVKLHIVCESFEFRRTEMHRDYINYIPREYIGVAKLFCHLHRITLYMQKAAQAKGFFSDDKVKKLALWVPGRKHAMDATRHYLYHRVFILDDKTLFEQLRP
jgi:hypothetical protein